MTYSTISIPKSVTGVKQKPSSRTAFYVSQSPSVLASQHFIKRTSFHIDKFHRHSLGNLTLPTSWWMEVGSFVVYVIFAVRTDANLPYDSDNARFFVKGILVPDSTENLSTIKLKNRFSAEGLLCRNQQKACLSQRGKTHF